MRGRRLAAWTTKTYNGRLALPVERIAEVDISDLRDWINAIDFSEWPQQEDRPAMVADLAWHGFGRATDPVVNELLRHFPGARDSQRFLSVVMAGHNIPPHRDGQSDDWIGRVHVPLTSNDHSRFIVDGIAYGLTPGAAYLIDTEVEHSVVNDGFSPRIHFMFDLRGR